MEQQFPIFSYGPTEMDYLSRRDPILGDAITRIGKIQRAVIPDLFGALVHAIIGQQISMKAQATIWQRMNQQFDPLTPQQIVQAGIADIQKVGISTRKATYIYQAAQRILSGELDINGLSTLSDDAVIRTLTTLNGIGVWTAEMLMLFSMQRPDVFSYGDYAIRKGLCLLHRHRDITPRLFTKYRRLYSPYGSVASLYLWAIAGEQSSSSPK